jgi:5-methylcytosine-specific restriction endonuclease McrA
MGQKKYGPTEWREIQEYVARGHGFIDCRNRFGIAHATWKKAILRGDLVLTGCRGTADARRVYDWKQVQAYYDCVRSFRKTKEHFGFSNAAWYKARQRGEIRSHAPDVMSIEQLLSGPRQRAHVKSRLLNAGILKNECSMCGVRSWQGAALSMHLDHINGIKDDHRLENLRMLCPNCHSQTETYGGRNLKRLRRLHGDGRVV